MDHHHSSPVYGGMLVESHLRDGTATKDASSSARSPTTVFAVGELHDVFRVADGGWEKDDRLADDAVKVERCPPICSLATDEELSTFSDDSDDSASSGVRPFAEHRPRRLLRSIFRLVGGTKRRRSDFSDDDEEDRKRPSSAPPLFRANPVGSGDDETLPMFPSSCSSASPFKRVRRGGSGSSIFDVGSAFCATSSLASPFAIGAQPTTMSNSQGKAADRRAIFSIEPKRSTNPHETHSILKVTNINRHG